MMNLTVVIPTLDEEENLPNCLGRLCPQLREGDKVIIVDGGSKDSTIDIAKKYDCTIYVAEDSSIGEARNIGSERVENEIVVSTDADSIPPDGWVERIRAHFEQDGELSVLWGNIIDRNGVPIRNMVGKFSTLFRGASGNNTAFRKRDFDRLDEKYPDVSFMEDVAIINKLSKIGKAKRDKNLAIVMNMERKRYQTVPILAMGTIGALAGNKFGGGIGNTVKGASMGMMGTEFTYEAIDKSMERPSESDKSRNIHHDQIGAVLAGIGKKIDGEKGYIVSGLGTGMALHHALTEGVSMMPTQLQQNTEEILE